MPGLLSSTVCLTVAWLLALCPSQAQIWTNEVSGVQYGRIGSNVTLACGMSQPGTPVEWRLDRGGTLPWHRVTSSDGTLVLLHVDQSAQGNYSCHDNHGHLVHTISLRLGYPPGELTVSCRVPNHVLVRCSWVDSVETALPSQYHATYRGSHQSAARLCVVDAPQRRCNITQPTFWQTAHFLNITETNALGSRSTLSTLRLHQLLKPDPPESLVTVGKEGSPTRLLVSWRYPSSWPVNSYSFPLVFQVRYRPQGSSHWSQIESKEGPVEILDALAGHAHQVQVRAQDEVDSYSQWSDWSPLLLAWPWREHSTAGPTSESFLDDLFPDTDDEPDTSTAKSHNSTMEDGSLGLVILLALFSVVIFTTVFSLVLVLWMRQRRRDHVNKQELSSMVKMKSMPI